jgi:three-Cys-motif partner protein
MKKRIDLHPLINNQCDRSCSKEERQKHTIDDICQKATSKIDGLPVRCVGPWAYEKIYFLSRYFIMFAKGMKDKWNGNLAYFEICSGPGRCINRENAEEIDGTPLVIMNSVGFQYLKKAYFIDIKQGIIDALNKRINAKNISSKAHALYGRYEDGDFIAKLINDTNNVGLNLVFIDPTDCSVPFSTIQKITSVRHVDIILNMAVWTDLNRNLAKAVLNPDYDSRRKYETFLGDSDFFNDPKIIEMAHYENYQDLRSQYMKRYRCKLQELGLKFVQEKPINGYYNLVFASADKKALHFWHQAAESIQPDGQRQLL